MFNPPVFRNSMISVRRASAKSCGLCLALKARSLLVTITIACTIISVMGHISPHSHFLHRANHEYYWWFDGKWGSGARVVLG